jgi:hypothetical protein
MTNPGIEPSNENKNDQQDEVPGIAPANAKKKFPLKTALAAATALGLAALALNKCSQDEPQPVTPQQPEASAPQAPQEPTRGPMFYRYRVAENTELKGQYGSVFVKQNSCVEGTIGPDGGIVRVGDGLEVQASAANGVDISTGVIANDKLINNGIRTPGVACTAEFILAAPANAPGVPETRGPVQNWTVVSGANLYSTADTTTPPALSLAGSSCVISTGSVRGDMMQVDVKGNGQQFRLWTPMADYAPAPGFVTADKCEAKM